MRKYFEFIINWHIVKGLHFSGGVESLNIKVKFIVRKYYGYRDIKI